MSIHSDNLNLNLNLNLAALGAVGGDTGFGRARFNTEDMDKLMPVPPPAALTMPQKPYAAYWDGELRAWAYVAEFISAINWAPPPLPAVPPVPWPFLLTPPVNNAPIPYFIGAIANQAGPGSFPVPAPVVLNRLDANKLAIEAVGVVNASLDRADRALEICDQATGPGALNYWTGLIRINPNQEPNAWLLMLVARKIGEYVAMGLKDYYRMRRPSQVYPYILPIIDPPDTPSFPSSHSLQAHLISNVLTAALTPPGGGQTAIALDHLAHRVARNREIAGLHYRMDSACGKFVADGCMAQLMTLPVAGSLFRALLTAATGELSDLP